MNIIDELYDMVRVSTNPDGTLACLEFPSTRAIARRYAQLGIRGHAEDLPLSVWSELQAKVRLTMPFLMSYANRQHGTSAPARTRPREEFVSASSSEARIREARGPELLALMATAGLTVESHPSNAGITAMRRKNALLAYVRRGGSLSAPTANVPATRVKRPVRWITE